MGVESRSEKQVSCFNRLSTDGSNVGWRPHSLEKKDENLIATTSSGVVAMEPPTRFILGGGARRQG